MADNTVTVAQKNGATTLSFSERFNVAAIFIDRHLGAGRGDKIAIRTEDGEDVSYAELAERVNRCGNALKTLGIGPGERLLMIVKDSPEFFYLFWGAIKAGIVPVPLNTLLRAPDYQYMIEDSGAASLVYSPEFASEAEPALASASHSPSHVFRTEGGGGDGGDGGDLAALMAGASPEIVPAPTAPDDDCFWLYSSGSTGKPKGAVHAHRSMVVTSQYYGVEALGMDADDICFSAAKLFFAYGLGNAMTFPLWVGATAVLAGGRPTPEMTFEVIERFKPSLFFGVPTLYAAQLKALEDSTPELSSLRACVSAGEALPPDLFHRWKERTGVTILEGIGTTEMLHIFISGLEGRTKPGCTGVIVPGYQARIVDEAGAEVPDGEAGSLLIRGDSAAKYYWNKPEKTADTMLGGGWLRTGDTYVRDADGFFQCHGRSDDMLKVGGIWCSPVEIEAKLVEHAKVLEAAVVGRADEAGLSKPEA